MLHYPVRGHRHTCGGITVDVGLGERGWGHCGYGQLVARTMPHRRHSRCPWTGPAGRNMLKNERVSHLARGDPVGVAQLSARGWGFRWSLSEIAGAPRWTE